MTSTDISILKSENAWFNNNIMHKYFLIQIRLSFFKTNEIFYMPMHLSKQIFEDQYMHKTKEKKDNFTIYDQKELVFDDQMPLQHQKIFKELQELSESKAITTFFNINNNHWVTAFISLKENLLCYIDPFGAEHATKSKMLTNVNKWMVALNRPKLDI